ncbi:MAG: energy-coupling factor ABC transporter ATP-binding protein [Sulfolobales archaeon]|nr:energy-coupling factor ABC transporter ATP-binding protein [Sulfolobales archaeon]
MAFIEIRNLHYRYPNSEAWVLKDIRLRFENEKAVIAGSTGSGKTTLLRVMSGLITRIYGGELVGEVEVNGRVAYVPQNFDLYMLMSTARDELTYILSGRGLTLTEVEIELRRLSDALGIHDILDRNIMKLSMGERQRVAIASALALSPDILLLDEPFAHIDPKGVLNLLKILKGIDVTVIIAEHKLRYLFGWINRVVLLREGTVVYDGPLSNAPPLDQDIEWPLELIMRGDLIRVN